MQTRRLARLGLGWLCATCFSAAATAGVVLAEEFTDNRRGWPETHNQRGPATDLSVTITNGAYVCVNPTSGYWLGWTAVEVNQARDFQIEVSMRQTAGTASAYGVVWGLRDAGNFHEFSVWDSNRFSYAERAENEYCLLLSGQTEPVPMSALTTLAVRKRGPGIEFLVNGQSVGRAGFSDFFGDNIGFVVNGGMTVEIDRLVVSQPPAEDAAPPLPPPAQPEKRSPAPASPGAPAPAPLAPPAPPPAPSAETAPAPAPRWWPSVLIFCGGFALGLVLATVLAFRRARHGQGGKAPR